MVDFRKRLGITGNILDHFCESQMDITHILEQFTQQCVAAATIALKNCLLTAASLKTAKPANDVLNRMYEVVSNLKLKSLHNSDINVTYTFEDVGDRFPVVIVALLEEI